MSQTIEARTGNWGRWGDDDERGALNLLTPELVLAATRVCRTGKVYSLALPIQQEGMPVVPYRNPPMRLTLVNDSDQEMFAAYGGTDVGANEDVLILASHNETHMDALCHVYHQGRLYNGYPSDTVKTNAGATRCGIEKVGAIAGRAVVLDVPRFLGVDHLEGGHVVTAAELTGAADAQGTPFGTGDIVLVRTGWLEQYLADPTSAEMLSQPGLGYEAAALLVERDVVAVGADNAAVEVIPFDRNAFLGIHVELLVKGGIYLLENLVLADLARDGVHECLLVVAPLPVTGAMGSPINPIAIG